MKLMHVLKLLSGTNKFASRISPFLVPRTLQSLFIMAANDDAQITVLAERLSKAEKRLMTLTREMIDIKAKLSVLQSPRPPANARSFSTIASVDGPLPAKRMKVDFLMEGDYVVVYTDGACENNGRPNAKAGIGVWFSDDHPCNVAKPVVGRPTNNTAEIQACTEAVKIALRNDVKKLCIKTDSQFLISSMTQWIHRWKVKSWKLASGGPVKNKEDFMALDKELQNLEDVKWVHVNGHSGIKGNEEADKLARAGAEAY